LQLVETVLSRPRLTVGMQTYSTQFVELSLCCLLSEIGL